CRSKSAAISESSIGISHGRGSRCRSLEVIASALIQGAGRKCAKRFGRRVESADVNRQFAPRRIIDATEHVVVLCSASDSFGTEYCRCNSRGGYPLDQANCSDSRRELGCITCIKPQMIFQDRAAYCRTRRDETEIVLAKRVLVIISNSTSRCQLLE